MMKPVSIFALALFAAPLFAATPAEIAIKQGLANIQQQPNHYAYYADLAMAYARRARETGDSQYYAKAEETVQKSFAMAPANYDGLKVETWLELGRHEYAKALETATTLNKMTPDDIVVYGYLADAKAELGNYQEAVDATQWMLNLRPGNIGGLVRASYLRELHGNISGALDLMQMAYDATPLAESEDRAWILTQTAHLQLLAGNLAKTETYVNAALTSFPEYHSALAILAQVRIAQERYPDAVRILTKRHQSAPSTESLYALAEAQELAGQQEEAHASFREFESDALNESAMSHNANRQLIAYYIDHAHTPAKALEIARREIARQKDVLTLDAYAWALAANGDYQAAEQQLHKPIEMGIKDPEIIRHAAAIEKHLHQSAGAQ
jgi:tetratricopeptide (TPR) repeat protein